MIGHELAHAKHYHKTISFFLHVAGVLISGYLLKKAYKVSRLSDAIDYLFPGVPSLVKNLYVGINGLTVAMKLAPLLFRPLSRAREYEADATSVRLLSSIYGSDVLVEGAAHYLTRDSKVEKYSILEKLFSIHPHPRERLRKLRLSKEASKKAARELEVLLQEYNVSRIFMLLNLLLDNKEGSLEKAIKCENQWKTVKQKAAISSVDPETAQWCLERINHLKSRDFFDLVLAGIENYSAHGEMTADTKKSFADRLQDSGVQEEWWLSARECLFNVFEKKWALDHATLKDILSE